MQVGPQALLCKKVGVQVRMKFGRCVHPQVWTRDRFPGEGFVSASGVVKMALPSESCSL